MNVGESGPGFARGGRKATGFFLRAGPNWPTTQYGKREFGSVIFVFQTTHNKRQKAKDTASQRVVPALAPLLSLAPKYYLFLFELSRKPSFFKKIHYEFMTFFPKIEK